MIPIESINAWGEHAPWGELRHIEQDLIISRALVEIFSDKMLHSELRFRGGTALNKLHFPVPFRYSEDIDLTRVFPGPIGPIFDRLRGVLEPWLGRANSDLGVPASTLKFRTAAEDGEGVIRLKVEINTREREAFDPPHSFPYEVRNSWFSGKVDIATFSNEEILATKLRAFLQRDKGRDLYDLAHALEVIKGLNIDRVVELLGFYMDIYDQTVTRAEAQKRMFVKLRKKTLQDDLEPLLPTSQMQNMEGWTKEAFRSVFTTFIDRLPGEPWAKTPEMKERFSISW